MKMISLLRVMLLWAVATGVWAEGLAVTDGWVRLVPPVSENSAAYFTLHNKSDQPLEILSASSEVARVVELHNVIHEGGLMSMQKQDKVTVPAQKSLEFKPGSYHVMLIGLKQPLQENQAVTLTLHLAGGATTQVALTVKAEAGKPAQGDADMHHHHHH